MSRTNKTIKNSIFNFSFSLITIFLNFFSRKIFIDYLGDEVVGLTLTMYNILGFLNLAESGIAVSISYALYQPLFNGEKQKIKEIISILGHLYRKVGIIILAGAFVLSFFLPLIFKDAGLDLIYVYATFFVFLLSSLIGYFLNFKQVLMVANQQEYVVVSTFKICTIMKILCQICALKFLKLGFISWLSIELISSVVYTYLLNYRINKYFDWLHFKISEGKAFKKNYPHVIQKIKQVFFHQAAGFVLLQTSALFVYLFTDLSTVTKYANYTLITNQSVILLNTLLNSTYSSVGNLVAEGNRNSMIKIFNELISFRFFIAFVVVFCIYYLIEPFIGLWLGKGYILDKTILLLILSSTFITIVRGSVDSFISAYGLFHDVWATCTEAGLNIVVTVICGNLWGLLGIALGPVICTSIFVVFWKPYFLFKHGFKLKVTVYWKKVLRILTPNLLLFSMCAFILSSKEIEIQNFTYFFIYAVLLFVICTSLSYLISYVTNDSMRDLSKRIIYIFNKHILHKI